MTPSAGPGGDRKAPDQCLMSRPHELVRRWRVQSHALSSPDSTARAGCRQIAIAVFLHRKPSVATSARPGPGCGVEPSCAAVKPVNRHCSLWCMSRFSGHAMNDLPVLASPESAHAVESSARVPGTTVPPACHALARSRMSVTVWRWDRAGRCAGVEQVPEGWAGRARGHREAGLGCQPGKWAERHPAYRHQVGGGGV